MFLVPLGPACIRRALSASSCDRVGRWDEDGGGPRVRGTVLSPRGGAPGGRFMGDRVPLGRGGAGFLAEGSSSVSLSCYGHERAETCRHNLGMGREGDTTRAWWRLQKAMGCLGINLQIVPQPWARWTFGATQPPSWDPEARRLWRAGKVRRERDCGRLVWAEGRRKATAVEGRSCLGRWPDYGRGCWMEGRRSGRCDSVGGWLLQT